MKTALELAGRLTVRIIASSPNCNLRGFFSFFSILFYFVLSARPMTRVAYTKSRPRALMSFSMSDRRQLRTVMIGVTADDEPSTYPDDRPSTSRCTDHAADTDLS